MSAFWDERAEFAIGQLRHLYAQMVGGAVLDPAAAARGLLGPSIEALERVRARVAELERLEMPSADRYSAECDRLGVAQLTDAELDRWIGRYVRAVKP